MSEIVVKTFKSLFKIDKIVKLNTIQERLKLSQDQTVEQFLKDHKLSSYYDLRSDVLIRNNKPTPWEKLKVQLKKGSKYLLSRSIPLALGLATGGAAIGVIGAFLAKDIISKFKERGLKVSESSEESVEDVIQNKGDQSVDTLVKKLKDDNKTGILDSRRVNNLIKLSLNEQLSPILTETQVVMMRLQENQGQFQEIFNDWADEQRESLTALKLGQEKEISFTISILNEIEKELKPALKRFEEKLDKIEAGINQSSQVLGEANKNIIRMDEKIDKFFKEVCEESLTQFTLPEMLQTSRIQFQKVVLAGKMDYSYDSSMFVENPSIQRVFLDFLMQKGHYVPIYLLLANMGMGKTWNAVHFGNVAREMDLAIPFFIPLHLGYEELLRDIFGTKGSGIAHEIGQKCDLIFQNVQRRILMIFDGFDEYPIENRQSFLNFLEQLLHGYDKSISIVLTDRIIDWRQNDYIQRFYQKINSLIYSNSELEEIRKRMSIPTPVSGYLDKFSNAQLDDAIQKYGLKRSIFPSKLYDLCQIPYILRLVYERNEYFNPENVEEFWGVFFNPEQPVNTILYRMGIIGSTEKSFFQLIDVFNNATAQKTDRDLADFINNHELDWQIILCSGILQETRDQKRGMITYYQFDPLFQPVIRYYLRIMNENKDIGGAFETPQEKLAKIENQFRELAQKANYNESNQAWTEAKEVWIQILGLASIHGWESRRVAAEKQKIYCLQKEDEELKLMDFDGVSLIKREYDVMLKLESELGIIPEVELVEEKTFGFVADNGHIIQLGLCPDDLKLQNVTRKIKKTLNDTLSPISKKESQNPLRDALGGVFNKIKKIPYSNKIEILNENICQLKELMVLNLNGNILETLPLSIGNLIKLRRLTVSRNRLKIMPDSIIKLQSLQFLDLSQNKLETLSNYINELRSLQILNLNSNLLSGIPDNINKLQYLLKLDLSNNKLTDLPTSIGLLKLLQKFLISTNLFVNLPETIGELISLKDLDLKNGIMKPLSDKAQNALKKLRLQGCNIIE